MAANGENRLSEQTQEGDGQPASESSSQFSRSIQGMSELTFKAVSHFYTEELPIFPLLMQMEGKWPKKLVWASHGIDLLIPAVLMMARVVNWSFFFTLVHIPVWNPDMVRYGDGSKVACMVLFWASFVVVVGTFAQMAYLVYNKGHHQMPAHVAVVLKFVNHAFGGPVFIGVVHLCCVMATCYGGNVLAFQDEGCWGLWHSVHAASALICGMAAVVLYVTARKFLFSMVPTFSSGCPSSRAHSYCDTIDLAYKLLLVTLTHLPSFESAYPKIILVASVLYAASIAFLMPYYDMAMNRMKVVGLAVVAWGAFMVAVEPSYPAPSWRVAVYFVGLAFVIPVGYTLATVRVTSGYHNAMTAINKGDTSALHQMQQHANPYPAGLPNSELIFSPYRLILESYSQDKFVSEAEESQADQEKPPNLGTTDTTIHPLIPTVWYHTDVELASRSRRGLMMSQGLLSCPRSLMKKGMQLFMKGLLKYPMNCLVSLHFALHLVFYGAGVLDPRGSRNTALVQAALKEAEVLMGYNSIFGVFYQSYKLQVFCKPIIGITSDSHRKVTNAALRIHREILSLMSRFWHKLLAENVDTLQLAGIAKTVTARRTVGVHQFQKALQHPTLGVVRRYANFLRQVMLDSDAADLLEQRLADAAERKKELRGGGEQMRADVALSELRTKYMGGFMGRFGLRGGGREEDRSTTIGQLELNMNIMFALLVLVLIASMVYEAVSWNHRMKDVDRASSGGTVRALASQAALLVQRMQTEGGSEVLKQQLKDVARVFVDTHRELSHGSLSSSYAPHQKYYQEPLCEHIELPTDSSLKRGLSPLWNLGSQFGNALLSLAESPGSSLPHDALNYVLANSEMVIGTAFNRSMAYYTEAGEHTARSERYVTIGQFCVLLVLVLVVYLLLSMSFQRIGTFKLSTLNLFTLIPRIHIERLSNEAQDRVDNFRMEEDDTAITSTDCAPNGTLSNGGSKAGLHNRNGIESSSKEEPSAANGANLLGGKQSETTDEGNGVVAGQNGHGTHGTHGTHDPALESHDLGSSHVEDKMEWKRKQRRGSGRATVKEGLPLLFFLSKGILLILAIISLVLLAVFIVNIQSDYEGIVMEDERNDVILEYMDAIDSMTLNSQQFTQFGDLWNLGNYWKRVKQVAFALPHRQLVALSNGDTEAAARLVEIASALDDVTLYHQISQALWVHSDPLFPEVLRQHLSGVRWNLSSRAVSERPPPYPATDSAVDRQKDPTLQRNISRSLLVSDRFNAELMKAGGALESLYRWHSTAFNPSYPNVVTALYCITLVLLLVVAIAISRDGHLSKFPELMFLLALLLVLNVVVLVVVTLLDDDITTVHDALGSRSTAVQNYRALDELVKNRVAHSFGYTQFGDKSFYLDFLDLGDGSKEQTLIHDLLSVHPEANFSSLSSILHHLELLVHESKIAVFLGAAAFGHNESSSFEWMRKFRYNYSYISLDHLARFAKHHPELKYSDPSADLRKNISLLQSIARYSISSPEADYDRKMVQHTNEKVMLDTKTAKTSVVDDTFEDMHTKALIATVFAAVVAALVVLLVILVAMRMALVTGENDGMLFPELTLRTRIALSFVAVLLCLFYIWVTVDNVGSSKVAADVDYASSREWLVAQTAFLAVKALDPALPTHARYTYLAETRLLVEEIRRVQNRLYFSPSGLNVPGRSDRIDRELFGHQNSHGAQHQCDVGWEGTQGLEVEMHEWMHLMLNITESLHSTESELDALRSRVIALHDGLFARLRKNTVNIVDYTKDMVEDSIVRYFLLLGAVLVAVLMEYIFVFRPMVAMLRKEGEGTKLMLTMIPREVRESVPSIAEYLATGVITKDERVHEINNAIVKYAAVPTIVIDHTGTMLSFSQAAVEMFGYDTEEAIGKNVKILMPDDVALKHDGYLLNYQRTGVKKVINGCLRVQALTRGGVLFPAVITVREFVGQSGINFVGCLQDISTKIALERQLRLSDAIIHLSQTPIIVLNTKGIVLRFSRAAEVVFGYNAAEVCDGGTNVTILQPHEIAVKHDQYLATYMATKVKKVIDSKRRTRGRKANGAIFEIELLVKELMDDRGETRGFVGYLRDCTKENQLIQAALISDAIVSISPIPLITIDSMGTVSSFNKAAERDFLYPSRDVIGKNVKMLMPPEISKVHDSYLARYMRTGEKRVINQQRIVVARRSNGALYEAEISAREIQRGKFIAYVEDVTEDRLLAQELALQSSIITHSSFPIIIINEVGRIKTFNTAAEELFGYSANVMENKNVKVLMTDEYAKAHDGYLSRYLATGKKNVIGQTRRVTGKHRESHILMIELQIHEYVLSASERVYIGYLRDVREEALIEQANSVNNVITDLSVTPVITIDMRGFIRKFNHAAETFFGWTVPEVLGKNITLLQPDEVAAKHDFYLIEYQRRRRKKVVDNTRRVFAKIRSGTLVPVDITVHEVLMGGQSSLFIGSLRDVREELEIQSKQQLNDSIIGLSSIPFIAITQRGIVQVFNTAAAKMFDYEPKEIIGENVKILMPDEVARFHDNYLRVYLRTGKKTVIDSRRKVLGKAKDRLVPLELVVKEAVLGTSKLYLGFAHDRTNAHALSQQAEIKESVIQLSPIPIVTIDAFGKILSFPPAAEHDLGYTSEEALGRNVKMLMPDQFASNHDMYLKRYRKTGEKRIIDSIREVEGKRKDGRTYPIEISVREVRDGKEVVLIGYMRDIKAHNELLEMRVEGTAVMNMATSAFITINQEGLIETWGASATRLWGHSENDVIGQNVKILMPPEQAEHHDEYIRRYLDTKVKRVIDTTRRLHALHRDGHLFPIELSVREIIGLMGDNDGDGTSPSEVKDRIFVGQCRDVTEENSSTQDDLLSAIIIEASVFPIVIITEDGLVEEFNSAAAREFQFTKEEVRGKNVCFMIPEEIAKHHDSYLERYRITRVANMIGKTREVTAKRKDGSKVPCLLQIREINKKECPTVYVGYLESLEPKIAMARSLKLAEDTLDLCALAVFTIDPFGIVSKMNRAASNLFGYPKEEVIGKNIKIIMPEDVAKVHDEYLVMYRKTGVKHVIDSSRRVTGQTKDGVAFPCEIVVRELVFKDIGSVYIGYIRDLNQEAVLQQAYVVNDIVAGISTIPMIAIDHKGVVLKFSKAAEDTFKWPANEILNHNVKKLMPPETAVHHDGYLAAYRRTGKKTVVDQKRVVVACKRDGTRFHVELTVKEIKSDGEESTFVAFVEDTTQANLYHRMKKENELLCESAPLGIVCINEVGIVQVFNPAAEAMWGYSKPELIGQNIKKLMPPRVAEAHDEYLAAYKKTGKKNIVDSTRRIQALHKDGSLLAIQITVREVKRYDGTSYFVGYVTALKKRVELERLQKLNKAVLELTGIPVICINEEGNILRFTKIAEKMFGYHEDDILGKNVKLLMPDHIARNHDKFLANYRKTRVRTMIGKTTAVTARNKNGKTFPIRITVQETEDGGKRFYVGFPRLLAE